VKSARIFFSIKEIFFSLPYSPASPPPPGPAAVSSPSALIAFKEIVMLSINLCGIYLFIENNTKKKEPWADTRRLFKYFF
jgi:hypothetical protein